MKHFISVVFAILLAATAVTAVAQPRPFSEADRQRFRAEMRNYKHEFLAKELSLTREQQQEFFALYDEMDDAVDRVANDTRELERKVADNPSASDVEIEAAARAAYSQKYTEGEIEQSYFEKFRQVLKPKQLLQLRAAERKFTQQLMRHHRKMKDGERK